MEQISRNLIIENVGHRQCTIFGCRDLICTEHGVLCSRHLMEARDKAHKKGGKSTRRIIIRITRKDPEVGK